MEIDVHFPISNSFSYNNSHDLAFLHLFEKKYNTNQAKYTHIGYNIIMNFCSNYKAFKFKTLNNGGRVNIKAPLYHYDDYKLVPVN